MTNSYDDFRDMSKRHVAMCIKLGLALQELTASQERATNDVDHSDEQKFGTRYMEYIKPVFNKILKSAEDWDDIHRAFNYAGLKLVKSGRGLIVHDAKNDTTVKVSSFCRNFSLAKLEKQFCKFQPACHKYVKNSVDAKAMGWNLLYQQFNFFREERQKHKILALDTLRNIAKIKRHTENNEYRLKRNATYRSSMTPSQKRINYLRLAENNRIHLANITRFYADARKQVYTDHGNMTFQQYLCHAAANGDDEALAKLRQDTERKFKNEELSEEG